jgi:small subunit ribosomal protein S17
MPTTKTKKTPAPASPAAAKKVATKVGVVESDKRSKSRTVVVRFSSPHAKYGKFMGRKTVIQVHDEKNESRLGDTVEIQPCRPISKTKRWSLVRVVEKSQRVELVTTQV